MYCKNCGAEIDDKAVVCLKCGCATDNAVQPVQQGKSDISRDIQSAKKLGLVGLIVGIFIPIVGWICGGIGLSNCNGLLTIAKTEDERTRILDAQKMNKIALIVTTAIFVVSLLVSLIVINSIY